ncbi:MAG: hypothetical protein N2691_04380 [Patescibacteria group bacterium]|nr:hypothetical protein [Patescibacteria group bacterium]
MSVEAPRFLHNRAEREHRRNETLIALLTSVLEALRALREQVQRTPEQRYGDDVAANVVPISGGYAEAPAWRASLYDTDYLVSQDDENLIVCKLELRNADAAPAGVEEPFYEFADTVTFLYPKRELASGEPSLSGSPVATKEDILPLMHIIEASRRVDMSLEQLQAFMVAIAEQDGADQVKFDAAVTAGRTGTSGTIPMPFDETAAAGDGEVTQAKRKERKDIRKKKRGFASNSSYPGKGN